MIFRTISAFAKIMNFWTKINKLNSEKYVIKLYKKRERERRVCIAPDKS